MKLESNDDKFSIEYLPGGQNVFIFKNILTQQLIANNMYDLNSNNIISISMNEDEKYQSASITKVAERKLNQLTINVKTYNNRDKKCILFDEEYNSEQSFLLANSSANLSNTTAESDILLINSENISLEIIDDLLLYPDNKCAALE